MFALPAGWGPGVTSHVGGASTERPVSTIVRFVLSNVISFIMPTMPAVSPDCAITTNNGLCDHGKHTVSRLQVKEIFLTSLDLSRLSGEEVFRLND